MWRFGFDYVVVIIFLPYAFNPACVCILLHEEVIFMIEKIKCVPYFMHLFSLIIIEF